MLLFFFLAKKKRREILCDKFCTRKQKKSKHSKRRIKKQLLYSKQIFRMPTLYIQERANKGVCKPKADSEVRAIPPDGLNEFSLGQCCLEREKLAGERCSPLQIFVFKKGNGAMWASPPTNPPVSYADIPAQGTPFGRLFKGDKATPLPCRASPLGEETVLLAPLTGHPKGVPCAELASRRLD